MRLRPENDFTYETDSTLRYVGSSTITSPGAEFNTGFTWSFGMLSNLEVAETVILELSQNVSLGRDLIIGDTAAMTIRSNYLNVAGGSDVNGILNLGSGTATFTGTFDATGGTVSFDDGVTDYTGNMFFSGQVVSLGTFEAGSSTVTYNGTDDQNVADATYYNLTIANSADAEAFIGEGITVNVLKTLQVDSGSILTLEDGVILSPVLDVDGNFNVEGTLNGGSGMIYIAEDTPELGTFVAQNSTVIYNGGVQTVDINTYNNLRISGVDGAIKSIAESMTINSDLTIDANQSLYFTEDGKTLNVGGDAVC